MINLIVISATVLILVAVLLAVSVKSLVKTGPGEVLIVKSIFSSTYQVKPEGRQIASNHTFRKESKNYIWILYHIN